MAHREAAKTDRSHAERMAARDGYFAPESVIRRIGNSPLTPFLGGGPAVLLQVAHPLVAAGVVDHSDYRGDLWGRLRRTLQALYLITYGSREEAQRAGAIVQAVHEHVHGVTRERLGPFPPGTPYRACDPALQLWVHATLVECSLAVYERFVDRLSDAERERYYREMRVVGRLLGVPGAVLPRTLREFREYFAAQIAGPEITVTPPAHDVGRVIVEADLPQPMRLLVPAHRLACAGLLPARLRREYGLRWTPVHANTLPLAARAMRVATAPVLRLGSHLRPPPLTARRTGVPA
jgi:uncharacterized protein (DUF2236 family)